MVQRLILIETRKYDRLFAGDWILVKLQALSADGGNWKIAGERELKIYWIRRGRQS